ncbi:MAG: ATP-binding cassette domain-containing protein, partial [Thermoplasmata archaeon]|nr:ATP-binding cassette domain-containing protein [Thermoplasmata archaeon]
MTTTTERAWTGTPHIMRITDPVVRFEDLSVWYGEKPGIRDITLDIPRHQVTAVIGPSGCGKSTFLRAINRMNDTIPTSRTEGRLLIDDEDVYAEDTDVVLLRTKVGLIFQQPNPFPKSIYENVAFAVRLHYSATREEIDGIV